jgi:hypothetical protein
LDIIGFAYWYHRQKEKQAEACLLRNTEDESLYITLCDHSLGNLQETCDIGTIDEIVFCAVFFSSGIDRNINVFHDTLQLLVDHL